MKIHTLTREQFVERPLSEVFSFFSKPENLALITPESMSFVIFTPSPIIMKEGAIIDYSVKVFGIRTRWTTLISQFNPPYSFVDEQLRGPYSYWHHTHSFQETDGGTNIKDEVRYVLPFGFAGEMMQSILVQPQLEQIFHHRKKVIERLFPSQVNSTNLIDHQKKKEPIL